MQENDGFIVWVNDGETGDEVGACVYQNEVANYKFGYFTPTTLVVGEENIMSGDLTLTAVYNQLYTVTFMSLANTNLSCSENPIKVESGSTITSAVSADGNTITYYYSGNVVATYTIANEVYQFKGTGSTFTINNNTTITPEIELRLCTVTIKNNSNYATMTVNESAVTEATFTLKFGTYINVTKSALKQGEVIYLQYVYSFTNSDGEEKEVKFITTDIKYCMRSNGLDSSKDETTYLLSSDDGVANKIIEPVFGLKEYNVELG